MIRVDPGGPFSFKPGKYATLGVQTPEKRSERAYSIASSPLESEVDFSSNWCRKASSPPSSISCRPATSYFTMRKSAKGLFTLDQKSGRTNHFMVSTVTGVAPFVSYVRTLYRAWKDGSFKGEHKLFLLNGASRSWEFGYNDELCKFAAEVPWFKYAPTVSRPWEDENGPAKWAGLMM